MKKSTLPTRLLALAAAVATAATVAVGGASSAEAAKRPTSTDVSSAKPALSAEAKAAGAAKFGPAATEAQTLEAYWTPERMRAAKPAEDDTALASAATAYVQKQQADQKAGRKPVTNEGPVRSADGVASKVFGSASTAGGFAAAYNPNLPYYVPTAYTAGKVFFSKPDGNYVCSGTIVNSEGKDTVWPAGHCVHGGQGGT